MQGEDIFAIAITIQL